MIGAGIFALTGQIAELGGRGSRSPSLPAASSPGSAPTPMSRCRTPIPSAGGIAMILQKAYGPGAIAAAASLLMALSMVINESLVARTFGTYVLRPFGSGGQPTPCPGARGRADRLRLCGEYLGQPIRRLFSVVMAFLKIGGIAIFGIAALGLAGLRSHLRRFVGNRTDRRLYGVGRAVDPRLQGLHHDHQQRRRDRRSAPQCRSRDRLLDSDLRRWSTCSSRSQSAPASRSTRSSPPRTIRWPRRRSRRSGAYGFYFTIALAIIATASGLLASVFAVSRMLAMLTEMKMIPHSHFGMSGPIREHTLVYTVVIAGFLTVFFDLSRIASLGAFFYLVMDILIHWGVFRRLRREIERKRLGAGHSHRSRRDRARRLRRDEAAVRPGYRGHRRRRHSRGFRI